MLSEWRAGVRLVDLVLMGHTAEFVVRHGYALLFVWLLAEQGALPLPSVPLLLACGALSRSGQLNPVLVVLSGVAACLIADNVWFQLGRRRGGRILNFLCRIALEPDSCVRKTENAFAKYGVRSLLVSKFVPGLNAVAAPMAGSSGTTFGRFLWFDTLGALIWMSTYCGLGYVFSDQLETVGLYAMRMGSGLIGLLVPHCWRPGSRGSSFSGSASSEISRWRGSRRRNCATSWRPAKI